MEISFRQENRMRNGWLLLSGGVSALFCSLRYEYLSAGLTVFVFVCILTVAAFLDMNTRIIPDSCDIAILIVTFVSFITKPLPLSFVARVIGAVCVSVPMLLAALFRSGAFGGGDIKFMGVCGLFLGWKLTLLAATSAILCGGIYSLWLLLVKKAERKTHIAFGPFLSLGMVIALLYGTPLIKWFIS